MEENNLNIADLIKALPEIDKLQDVLAKFSPFKVLGVADFEIRHSNIIAWLLNPNESHGLGDKFLKYFFQQILLSSENQEMQNRESILQKITLNNLVDLDVMREANNIDVLLVSTNTKFVCLIENKVHSSEHGQQLMKYLKHIKDNYPTYLIFPIFLTLDGSLASHNDYFTASYIQIIEVLETIIANYKDDINKNVFTFLDQYIKILKQKTMTETSLTEVARKIYKENKEAIDFIHTVGNAIDVSCVKDGFLKLHPNLEVIWPNPNWFTFIDKDFLINKKMDNTWAQGNIIQYWASPYGDKLKFSLEVGPFDDGNERLDFLLALEKNGIDIREASKKETGKYTRIWSITKPIKDWQDKEDILDKIDSLYTNKALQDISKKVIKTIKEFTAFW